MSGATTISLLSLLLLFHVADYASGELFVLPTNWTTSPGSAGSLTINTDRGTFFPATNSTGSPIASNGSAFILGFLKPNNSNFILSVVISPSSARATTVWSLNPSRPIPGNCSLSLSGNRTIVLKDANGSVVGTLGGSGAKMLGMLENGNLQVYNTSTRSLAVDRRVIWQSWDYPSDVLLPEQTLRQGAALSDGTSGLYNLRMHAGGAILYYSGQPYKTLPMTSNTSVAGAVQPCFSPSNLSAAGQSFAEYTGFSLELYYSGRASNSSASCSFLNSSTYLDSGDRNDSTTGILRLDADGNLRTYALMPPQPWNSNFSLDWRPERELVSPQQSCDLPSFCGSYGLCRSQQCSCPGVDSADHFDQINPSDVTAGCKPRNAINCTSGSQTAIHFIRIPAYDYFLNDLKPPENYTSNVTACESLCSASCACRAYFYRNFSGECFLVSGNIYTLKYAANDSYHAGIKVQNATTLVATQARSRSHLSVFSIIGITIGCLALVFAVFRCVWRPRAVSSIADIKDEEDSEEDKDELEEEEFLKTLPGLPPRFTFAALRDATNGFSQKLGMGGFGTVFGGTLPDGTRVAVKKLETLRQGSRQFRAEVATIGSISHVNLVRLRGFCADSRHRLLVYELLPNGSLDRWLFEPRPPTSATKAQDQPSTGLLNWRQRHFAAVGTARGLAYLHEGCREPIMHLDIKPQNILLDDRFVAKLSDFGMSRLLGEGETTQVVTAVRGTPGYLAPEWIRYSVATKKCDVYSYGMVLLELVSGRRNFVPEAEDPRHCYFPAWAMLKAMEGQFNEVVDARLKLTETEMEEAERMTKVAFWCIQEQPNRRPCMVTVVKMLEGEAEVEAPPLWLVESERAPRFLEAYGYDQVAGSMEDGSEPVSFCTRCGSEVSEPR
ncbi:G-type lectin S-receptor-like serine/threonine-protein kinase SD2-5 [Nymphaea thermarum]|nr:G-type lectin S-receptor-like serine/threonine-protein kinase SD2-5 [Nymphaea thermarum]